MRRHTVIALALATCIGWIGLAPTAVSSDLYQVTLRSSEDAEVVSTSGADAIVRLSHGYLILMDQATSKQLRQNGLTTILVATGLSRENLALDMRRDNLNAERFTVLFEEGNRRLLDVSNIGDYDSREWLGLARLPSRSLPIVYRAPRRIDVNKALASRDLDSLISAVEADSCQSYVERLQAFQTRKTGTDSNAASCAWLIDKFQEFGIDSIYTDTFLAVENWGTGDTLVAHNVIATKLGSVFPDHHIVIGAHRDSWPLESPGADDNGTGTAGVLELARIVADLDTRLTMVFIGFDAEEEGLWGAMHYSDRAAIRGDSIALMINMDMIGYMENDSNVKITHTASGAYGPLWADLADFLAGINLTAHRSSGATWDAEPFEQHGYEALTVHEYELLPYIHTARDSAVYIDFDYMARNLKATLATVAVVDSVHTIAPLRFLLAEEIPDLIPAGRPYPIELQLVEYGPGSLVTGSVQLHYSIDHAPFTSLLMEPAEEGRYAATIPPIYSTSDVRLYFSAEDATTGIWMYPDSSDPFISVNATQSEVVFQDDFNGDQGWTVTGDLMRGTWERGIPQWEGLWGAPRYDYDGSGYCYVTDNRRLLNVDDGTTHLVSPEINLSGGKGLVRYARWYANYYPMGEPYADTFRVYIRELGSSWVLVEMVGPVEQADGGWFGRQLLVNEFVGTDNPVQLRFDASDVGEPSTVEAAIDDFAVSLFTCPPLVLTDSLPDWTAGVDYVAPLEAAACCSLLSWSDKNGDLSGTGLSLLSTGILSGRPASSGTIDFIAVATDDSSRTGEQALQLLINPAVSITSETLPQGQVSVSYECQLEASGGTGPHMWTDTHGDLAGCGLSLDSSGWLSGVPLDSGVCSFTAGVADAVGSSDEKVLAISIDVFYICGDVDSDLSGPNVADLTYLVAFLFSGGPPPPVEGAANIDGLYEGEFAVTVSDLTYLVDYLFAGGPEPVCLGG